MPDSLVRYDGSSLRQASGAPLSFRERAVTLVRIAADGRLEQAGTVAEQQELLRRLVVEDGLFSRLDWAVSN
jgi:hypothetical protein